MRTYKRISSRCTYSSETLRSAVTEIRNGMSKRKASAVYGIPRATLIKQLKSISPALPKLGRFRRVFSDEYECELMMHLVEMQNRFYGLGLLDLRRIAFELAEQNGFTHPFSRKTKLAGEDWAAAFLKRNPELSLRRPEPTSLSRLSGFNRVQVSRFFGLLKDQLATQKFQPHRIYNVDETGITTVHVPGKILAKKGCKQVGRIVSGEKGTTTTVVCGMNASGHYVPPMFIFKRKRWTDLLIRNCPNGSIGHPSPNGWIDQDLFLTYLQHFVAFTTPTEASPILLVIDGHQSHKSLRAIEFARQNFITIVTLPPHSSHRLQPLDLTFFGPLKKAINAEMDRWMLNHAATRITDYDLCGIFTPAYQRVASVEKAVSGFAASGIWPFMPDKFGDEDFAPATVTELPSCDQRHNDRQVLNDSESQSVRVSDISPLPQLKNNTSGRKRRAEAAEVITSSPYRSAVVQKELIKQTPTGKAKKSRRIICAPSSDELMSQTRANDKSSRAVNRKRPASGKCSVSGKAKSFADNSHISSAKTSNSKCHQLSTLSKKCSGRKKSTSLPPDSVVSSGKSRRSKQSVTTRPRSHNHQSLLPRQPVKKSLAG